MILEVLLATAGGCAIIGGGVKALMWLGSPVPPKEIFVPKPEQPLDLIDEAFKRMDEDEATQGVVGLPPQRKQPAVAVPTEADRIHPQQRVAKTVPLPVRQVPPGPHPCLHLGPAPSSMRQECQGLCEHRSQRGRFCYWTPTKAHECLLYEIKNSLLPRAR